jgi:hypothetical protein
MALESAGIVAVLPGKIDNGVGDCLVVVAETGGCAVDEGCMTAGVQAGRLKMSESPKSSHAQSRAGHAHWSNLSRFFKYIYQNPNLLGRHGIQPF